MLGWDPPTQRRHPWPCPWGHRQRACPGEVHPGLRTHEHESLSTPLRSKLQALRGPAAMTTPEKEGTEETGVGYFQRVLLVARTLDSQITAGAHLCRLCFLTRSLTPDSCVGCLPSPMPRPPLSTLCAPSRRTGFDSDSWPGPIGPESQPFAWLLVQVQTQGREVSCQWLVGAASRAGSGCGGDFQGREGKPARPLPAAR